MQGSRQAIQGCQKACRGDNQGSKAYVWESTVYTSPYEPTRTTSEHDPASLGFNLTPNTVSELSVPHVLNHSNFSFVDAILSSGHGPLYVYIIITFYNFTH